MATEKAPALKARFTAGWIETRFQRLVCTAPCFLGRCPRLTPETAPFGAERMREGLGDPRACHPFPFTGASSDNWPTPRAA